MEVDDVEEEEFGFSRNYFLSKELTGSSKKSASKLSDIDLVSEQDLIEAASNIVPKHEKETFTLLNSYKSLYSKWRFELRCGFGLMMYGFGSKKSLLEDFASVSLEDVGVVVINGYLPSVNVKHATVAMAEVLWSQMKANQSVCSVICPNLKQPFDSQSMEDLLAFLDGSHSKDKEGFICVIIHNIDGPGLRDSETQHHLAQVAQCSHVRIVASIDHVNAPLLWDKKMVHIQFNWCWYHVPTFAPYKAESIFCPLILTNTGHTQTAKTAAIVLQSLTPNAQSVFKVLAQYQMAHSDEEGLLVSSLYNMCRERFLVSSQLTLNAHLTEFKDHNLVRTRRHSDGGDCLYIPLTSDVLEKLVQEIA